MNESLRMTKRSRNGWASRKYHSVPAGKSAARPAICGARPNIGQPTAAGIMGAQGWGRVAGERVTCQACLSARRVARSQGARGENRQ
jgi:hypothetical protein